MSRTKPKPLRCPECKVVNGREPEAVVHSGDVGFAVCLVCEGRFTIQECEEANDEEPP